MLDLNIFNWEKSRIISKFVGKIVLTINILFIYYLYHISNNHRVSIEGKSPQKESYSVNSLWKMFGDVSQTRTGVQLSMTVDI